MVMRQQTVNGRSSWSAIIKHFGHKFEDSCDICLVEDGLSGSAKKNFVRFYYEEGESDSSMVFVCDDHAKKYNLRW